jgi:hypothetical protein
VVWSLRVAVLIRTAVHITDSHARHLSTQAALVMMVVVVVVIMFVIVVMIVVVLQIPICHSPSSILLRVEVERGTHRRRIWRIYY